MKKNVQVYDAYELYTAIEADGSQYPKYRDCLICSNGDFCVNYKDCTQRIMKPNEIAEKIDMPLWEVVMVDRYGMDVYALMFYERG